MANRMEWKSKIDLSSDRSRINPLTTISMQQNVSLVFPRNFDIILWKYFFGTTKLYR